MTTVLDKPFDLVLFGGTGDLSLRKLLPSMFRAFMEKEIPSDSRIFVSSRKQEDFDNTVSKIKTAFKKFMLKDEFDEKQFKQFEQCIVPIIVDVADYNKGWQELIPYFEGREEVSRIFYLAIIPSIYGDCCENIDRAGLVSKNSRVVVEKPIGYDQVSAEAINQKIAEHFEEEQIYRIDHYLGKETVQNLLALRFSNSLFEQFWDSKSIDHIQISINEKVGLEGRAGFYDGAGAMRDMVQNHLLQLLGLVAMESPNKMGANNIRNEKIKVLQALRPITGDAVQRYTVRGQYVAGNVDDKLEPGYLEELGSGTSLTETFVAIRANIDNWRWAKVPFYLRTGKRLKRRSAEIVIQFKDVSHNAFGGDAGPLVPNRLIIQLQPEERMQLLLMAKDMTQLKTVLKPVKLDLNFTETSQGFKSFGYKRLLLDAIAGNASLFIHRDEGSAAWHWVDPIIDYWQKNDVVPHLYRAGTWGPAEADELIAKDKREWIDIEA
ncbi:MAG: glucose-6-phosphate dehydrogenase [Kangiellaceae bacterium]|nr:glucose-6-phosphate dehydrogenase [Kangiellaceae bacterium]